MMNATPSRLDGMDPIPIRLKGLSRDDWTTYREAAARYEAACSGTVEPPAINDFLPAPGTSPCARCCSST